jgi:hypothetical protein
MTRPVVEASFGLVTAQIEAGSGLDGAGASPGEADFRLEGRRRPHGSRPKTTARAGLRDPLARVLQFANISGPRVTHEGVLDPIRDGRHAHIPPAAVPLEKMLHQKRNVFGSLAKRRERDRQHVQPIEKVLTKLAFRHELFQIAFGSGKDADVDGDRSRSPQSFDSAVLQDAQ